MSDSPEGPISKPKKTGGRVGDGTPGPGRPKGLPNKITQEAREVFKRVFDNLAPEAEEWIRAAAAADPAKGADLLLRLSEKFIPSLARTELTGKDGEALKVSIAINRVAPKGEPANG